MFIQVIWEDWRRLRCRWLQKLNCYLFFFSSSSKSFFFSSHRSKQSLQNEWPHFNSVKPRINRWHIIHSYALGAGCFVIKSYPIISCFSAMLLMLMLMLEKFCSSMYKSLNHVKALLHSFTQITQQKYICVQNQKSENE